MITDTYCTLAVNVGTGEGTVQVQRNNVDPDLRVEIANDQSYVVLENSQLRVRYQAYVDGGEDQFAIKEFTIKAINQDQVGPGYMDAAQVRGALISAALIDDGVDKKTVRLEWATKPSFNFPGQTIVQEVSIYPNGLFLEFRHVEATFGFYFGDLARPGGVSGGQHVAYGGAGWVRGYVTYPDYYYNRFPGDGIDDPADGGSLNYNDHFIVGVFNPNNGAGFGRTLPIAATRIVRLLFNDGQRQGFDFYPPDEGHAPYVSYLFGVTGGADEILARGQALADAAGGDPGFQCGEEVTLEAVPDTGWYFNFWEGDLTGSINPAALTLTGQHTVTANFASDLYTLNVSLVPADGRGGAVVKSPDKSEYQYGEEVTLTVQPADGWTFQGWSGGLSGAELEKIVVMTADVNATATFTQDQYTLAVNVIGDGSVTVDPVKATYVYDDLVILTAEADPGWRFAGWTGAPAGNPTAIRITGNTAVTATFVQETYTLDVSVQGNGLVQVTPQKSAYVYDERVTLTAIPGPGKFFGGWGGDLSGMTNPIEVVMRGNLVVTALFTDRPPLNYVYLPIVVKQP
jgi:hypothetical protein